MPNVSQAVYNQLVALRDAALTNAANSTAIIATETANKAAYESQAADLSEIVDDLDVV